MASQATRHEFESLATARATTFPVSLLPQVTLTGFPYAVSQETEEVDVLPHVAAGHGGNADVAADDDAGLAETRDGPDVIEFAGVGM